MAFLSIPYELCYKLCIMNIPSVCRSQTSNGIAASESGQLVQPRTADEGAAYTTQGEFTYTGPDGNQYTVRYTADANGFHPEGAHLPRA